jgi:hypothetical protein
MVIYTPKSMDQFLVLVPLKTLTQEEYEQYCEQIGRDLMEQYFERKEVKEVHNARNKDPQTSVG